MTAPQRTTMNAGEFIRDHSHSISQVVRDLAQQGWEAADNGMAWPPINPAFEHVWLYDAWRLLHTVEAVAACAYTTVTGRSWESTHYDTKEAWRATERAERARIARLPHWRASLACPAA